VRRGGYHSFYGDPLRVSTPTRTNRPVRLGPVHPARYPCPVEGTAMDTTTGSDEHDDREPRRLRDSAALVSPSAPSPRAPASWTCFCCCPPRGPGRERGPHNHHGCEGRAHPDGISAEDLPGTSTLTRPAPGRPASAGRPGPSPFGSRDPCSGPAPESRTVPCNGSQWRLQPTRRYGRPLIPRSG
jgi:hypothetical protein